MLNKIKNKLEKNGIGEFEIALKINTELDESNTGLDSLPTIIKIDIVKYSGVELEKETKIGEYECVLIPGFSPEDKYNDLAFIADSYSPDTFRAVKGFINTDGTIKYDFLNPNIIYIKRVYLQPEYRNKGIGSYSFYLLYTLLKNLAGILTIYPYPNNKENEKPLLNFLNKFNFLEKGNGIWYIDTRYTLF